MNFAVSSINLNFVVILMWGCTQKGVTMPPSFEKRRKAKSPKKKATPNADEGRSNNIIALNCIGHYNNGVD